MQSKIVEVERALLVRDGQLHRFVTRAWSQVENATYIDNWHVGLICEGLEAVSKGQVKRLLINLPPACMKSLTVCVFWPVWDWLRCPTREIVTVSYDADLTRRDAEKSFDLIWSEWFRERWGGLLSVPRDVAMGDYKNNHGGKRFSASIGGPVTGRHFHHQIIDDPTKPMDLNPAGLARAVDYVRGTLSTRWKDAESGARVCIMQRLHDNDLAAYLRDTEGGYEVLELPMHFDPDRRAVTSFGIDPRTEDRELLFPARFPEAVVAKLEEALGSDAAAQLEQNPVAKGGGILKLAWLKYYDTRPAKFDKMIMSWDMSFKGESKNKNRVVDYVVGQVWGKHGANVYLLDQVRGQWDFPEVLKQFVALCVKWPKARAKYIEDKANGAAVISTLKKTIAGLLPVEPYGSKEARVSAVAPFFEAGNVWLPNGAAYVTAKDGLAYEIERFPRAKHDDQVDAMAQGVLALLGKGTRLADAMKKILESLA